MRTTEITIEIDQLVVLDLAEHTAWFACAACGMDVEMVSPEAAAFIAGTSVRAVYRSADAGALHCAVRHDDALLICLDSLHESMATAALAPGRPGK